MLSAMITNQHYSTANLFITHTYICICNNKYLKILPSKTSCKDLSLYYTFCESRLFYAKFSAISNLHFKIKSFLLEKAICRYTYSWCSIPFCRSMSALQRLYWIIIITCFAATSLYVMNKMTLRECFSKDFLVLMVPTNIKKKEYYNKHERFAALLFLHLQRQLSH